MRLPYLTRFWIAALAGVTLLTACGGGAAAPAPVTTTTAPPTYSQAAVAKAVGSVCSKLISDRQTLVDSYNNAHVTDPAVTREFLVNQLAPAYDTAAGALHRMPPPREDPVEWARIVQNIDSDLADWKLTITSDPAGAVTSDPFADIAPRMVAFGATDCAKF